MESNAIPPLLLASYPFLRKAQPFGKHPEPQELAFADSSEADMMASCSKWRTWPLCACSCQSFRLTVLESWGPVLPQESLASPT